MQVSLKDKLGGYLKMQGLSFSFLANNILNISYNGLMKKIQGKINFSITEAKTIIEYTKGFITIDDLSNKLSISSDKSNNNNQNLNVKNTTPSVSSDDKQIDVVDTAETQSSEPSEVAKSKVGGK